MFAIPSMPHKVNLLSSREVKDLKGKLECLEVICKKKRSELPELEIHLRTLYNNITAILAVKNLIRRSKTRAAVEKSFRRIAKLEHVVILVVVNGYEVKEAVEQARSL